MGHADVYNSWKSDPEIFWMEAAQAIDWDRPPSSAPDASRVDLYTYSLVNTSNNAVERHIENTRAARTALIYDSPIIWAKDFITFQQLRDKTALLAGALLAKGVTKGNRVIIYIPMVPETVIAMLGLREDRRSIRL